MLILQAAMTIRGIAVLRFCTSKSVQSPALVAYAVKRLLGEGV